MKLEDLDKEEYKEVPILLMEHNNHGHLPYFIGIHRLKGNSTNLHRHEYMQINYVLQGSAKHTINRQEFDIIKGDIFVIPPFIPHMITASDNESVEIVELECIPEFINENFKSLHNAEAFLDFAYIEPFLVSENLVKPRLNLMGKMMIETEAILNEIMKEYQDKKPGASLMIKSLFLKLLVLVGREYTCDISKTEGRTIYDRHRDAIVGAVRYMEDNYREELSVESVARKFALSQSYFSYLFKSITSKTFTEYMNSLRISKAMELLKNTDMKVLDVCLDVGFNNIHHFNRMFRQEIGMSPVAYRKKQ